MAGIHNYMLERDGVVSWWRRRVLVGVAAAALCVVLLGVRQWTTVSFGPLTLQPLPMFVVLTGLVAGVAGVTGATVGYVGYQAIQGLVAIWGGLGLFTMGLLASLSWGALSRTETNDVPAVRSVNQAFEFLGVTLIACLGGATIAAWGYEVSGQLTFYPTAVFTVLSWILSTVVGGAVVLGTISLLVSTPRWRRLVRTLRPEYSALPDDRRSWLVITTVLITVWFLLGSFVSLGFQVVELVPPFHLRLRELSPLLFFTDTGPFNQGGATLQLALGTSMLTLWTISLRRWEFL